jgi:hypothetical protein
MNDIEKKRLEKDIAEVCGIIEEHAPCEHKNGTITPTGTEEHGWLCCPDCGYEGFIILKKPWE